MSAPALRIDESGVGILSLEGAVDARNAAAVENALACDDVRTVVLDLERVRYVNSTGMAFLVNLGDRLEAAGGSLSLANAQPKVKVVLELMGLTSLLKLYAGVASAVRAAGLRARRPPLRRGSRA